MIKRFVMPLIALVAVAAIAAGCGDDDEAEGVTTSSMSKAEYVKEASEICANNNGEVSEEVGKLVSGEQTKEKARNLGAELTAILSESAQNQHDEIQELGAPEGSEDQVEAILAAMQQGIDEAEKNGAKDLESFTKEFKQFDKLAQDYGLSRCSFNI